MYKTKGLFIQKVLFCILFFLTLTVSGAKVSAAVGIRQVSMYGNHTAAVLEDGSLWCWGSNSSGQLGNGTKTSSKIPVKIMDGVVSASVGEYHTVALKEDGSLWCWGYNGSGQLGTGVLVDEYSPVCIMKLDSSDAGEGNNDNESTETENKDTGDTENGSENNSGTPESGSSGSKEPEENVILKKQTIKVAATIKKVYKKNAKFKLGAIANGKLTYVSKNKKVVDVSAAGIVTIKGYGNAKIRITAAATSQYKKTTKTIKISIIPGKINGLKVNSTSEGTLAIKWKRNTKVSGYEIQYSTSKKFAMGKTRSGSAPKKTNSTVVTNLKSGKTYYVRIRGFKLVKGVKMYGDWTTAKKAVIK